MHSLNSLYDKWHENVVATDNDLQLSRWHIEALKLAGDMSHKKLLEVGCGRGDFSIYLASKGANVTACDFSNAAINFAKQKIHMPSDLEFVVADAQNLPFEQEQFDTIFSCECLEHIPDPQKALNELFRVLKPGGIAVLTTENYSNGMIIPWIKSFISGKPFNSGDHVQPIENFFLFWNVKKMMRQSGFIVNKITGWQHVFLILPRNKNIIVKDFKNKALRALFKPFSRHMSFLLYKPNVSITQ